MKRQEVPLWFSVMAVGVRVLHGGWFISCSRFIIKLLLPTVCHAPTTVPRDLIICKTKSVYAWLTSRRNNRPSIHRLTLCFIENELGRDAKDSGPYQDNWLLIAYFYSYNRMDDILAYCVYRLKRDRRNTNCLIAWFTMHSIVVYRVYLFYCQLVFDLLHC